MNKRIQFRGQISPIISAIRMGGDSMRISFDVPLTERENAIGLLALTDQPLLFSIEVDNSPASTRIERPEDKPTTTFSVPELGYANRNGISTNEPGTIEKPKKEPKGPHSDYFRYLFRHGFQNYPDLIEVLGCAGDQIRLRLHDVFDVDSLSKVSPQEFEDWCTSEGLHSLIMLSRQAQAKLQETA